MYVVFDEANSFEQEKIVDDEDLEIPFEQLSVQNQDKENLNNVGNQHEEETIVQQIKEEPHEDPNISSLPKEWRFVPSHPKDLIIGDPSKWNVDLASFTFNAHSFNIEIFFVGMGWVPILTLNEKVYFTIVNDFYTKIKFSPGSGITCLLTNKRVKITQELIRSILHLEDGGIRLYTTKTIPHIQEYNPVEACYRVTEKHFEAAVRLSTNQLTLMCHVLHNIIAHIIVPRKGHLDEVNHYDVFLLDSILRGGKLDFSYIMIQRVSCVLSGTRAKALPYGMILTKIFQHFEVPVRDSVALLPKATDTINTPTLKRMKIFKEDGQWVAKTKGFDDKSQPSTLPFEGEEIDVDEDEPPPKSHSQRPSSSFADFTFTEDHYNCLMARSNSLTSTAEGLHNSMVTLQDLVADMTSLLHVLHFRLDAVLPPHLPPKD
ncbi:Uncharacterized protein Adt_02088 [Abeliophyllum distichum]|uniref:Putative plant transposon protein domain-containing protein n=1 Tax=Abeliophyllum distichum TaxID=126358 RepID=A0ABD1VUN4_9LAMI